MTFPPTASGHRATSVLVVLVALVASVLATAPEVAAQADQPALVLQDNLGLRHRSQVRVVADGLTPNVTYTISQCGSANGTQDCTILLQGSTGARGTVRQRVRVSREAFVNNQRYDCALGGCGILIEDGSSKTSAELDFDDSFPLPAIDVQPNNDLDAGDRITVTANAFRPARQNLKVHLCPAENYQRTACEIVTSVAPSGTAAFTVQRLLIGKNRVVDCASQAGACFLRIGEFEARWDIAFATTEPLADFSAVYSNTDNLSDGDPVTVTVRSPFQRIRVEQCVSGPTNMLHCEKLTGRQLATDDDLTSGEFLTKELTVTVRRSLYRDGQVTDCAAAPGTCFLQVTDAWFYEGRIGGWQPLTFNDAGDLPTPSLRVQNRKLTEGDTVKVRLAGMPTHPRRAVIQQCVAGTDTCATLGTRKLNNERVAKRVDLVRFIGSGENRVDCTAAARNCEIVVRTKSATIELRKSLSFK